MLRGSLYEKKITVNSRLEEIKTVAIGETSTWESVPQRRGFTGRSRLGGTYFSPMKTEGIWLVCYYVCRHGGF